VPQRADNALGRVVGVLRCALQGRIFGGRHRVGEITTDLFPAVAVSRRSGQRKAVLGELGRTETHEAQQSRLLLRRRRTACSLDLLRQADRGDVVSRARRPAARERTVAIEDVVAAVCDRAGFAQRRGGVSIVQVRCVTSGDSCGNLHARSETGAVEQGEGELRGVWHEFLRWRATARSEIRSVRCCSRDGWIAEGPDRSGWDEWPTTRRRT
jgi:hypothetical protein